MTMSKWLAAFFLFVVLEFSNTAFAETIPLEKCDTTLIQSTYMLTKDRFRDYRLAEHVNQSTYNELKKSAGLNAVIYGVPIGANWQDFQKNVSSASQDKNESLTENEFTNVVWTGLTDANNEAYSTCVNALVAASKGLNLFVEKATDTDVVVSLNWTARGMESNKINISWISSGLESSELPKVATAGTQYFDFKRPTKQTSIIVNSPDVGDGSFIVLTPLPKPPPPPPKIVLNTKCEIGATGRNISLAQGQTASWLCPRMAAGKYVTTFSISGDTPQGGARVTYGVVLQPSSGQPIPLANQACADVHVAPKPGLCPSALQANSAIVDIPQGDAELTISIGGVASQTNFANQNFGTVVLSPNVDIKLEAAQ